jgi:hypothetical protein
MTSRKKKGYRIVQIALLLLLAYSVLTGLSFFFSGGFMDFPCFAEYVEQDDCLLSYRYEDDTGESTSQIEVFLTTYTAGFRGGGCNYQNSEITTLDVQTSIVDLRLERDDSILKVNGEILAKGATFQKTNILNWSPWIVSRIHLRNLGLVSDCESDSTHPRIVIVGSYGTEVSIVKGVLIISAVIFGFILVNRKIKTFNDKSVFEIPPLQTTRYIFLT